MQLTLVELTDKLSKGTLQRPKHLDKSKNTSSDAQHEEPGIVLPWIISCKMRDNHNHC